MYRYPGYQSRPNIKDLQISRFIDPLFRIIPVFYISVQRLVQVYAACSSLQRLMTKITTRIGLTYSNRYLRQYVYIFLISIRYYQPLTFGSSLASSFEKKSSSRSLQLLKSYSSLVILLSLIKSVVIAIVKTYTAFFQQPSNITLRLNYHQRFFY